MNAPETARRWCQESPNNPISTKLRRNAVPIVALFAAAVLAVSFCSYVSYVVTHPVIQIILQPDVPNQPVPNTSQSTSNATQEQPVVPVYQPPPDYPSTTPSEMPRSEVSVPKFIVANYIVDGRNVTLLILHNGDNPPTILELSNHGPANSTFVGIGAVSGLG